ncbi:hypothetical protein F0919_16760 [Taibaiella lutea]|uniref:Uncharacterized protein n=1 Tax=Taibaiella lutea TaxID=2608001 RepID=A0A5M6CDA6_9BACT|nr:hypothetical protein [Taibaiella lutea]KAA5532440.1 hypothetical protein F0919_16760 [Taibaiella lutea]
MGNNNQKGDNQLHKNEVDRKTQHLAGEEIERMPASDDDYRLPRDLPEPESKEYKDENELAAEQDEADELIDGTTDISPQEIALLEEAGTDMDSDEAIGSDLLDETDEDGEPLNESSGQDVFFDMGEDLDMPNNVNNPDIDQEDEEF